MCPNVSAKTIEAPQHFYCGALDLRFYGGGEGNRTPGLNSAIAFANAFDLLRGGLGWSGMCHFGYSQHPNVSEMCHDPTPRKAVHAPTLAGGGVRSRWRGSSDDLAELLERDAGAVVQLDDLAHHAERDC